MEGEKIFSQEIRKLGKIDLDAFYFILDRKERDKIRIIIQLNDKFIIYIMHIL